jgi:polysaccharide export outer membrane protein
MQHGVRVFIFPSMAQSLPLAIDEAEQFLCMFENMNNYNGRGHMLRAKRTVVGLLFTCLSVACTSTHRAGTVYQYPVGPMEAYLLQAPDQIDISVLPQAELNRVVIIRPDGKVSLPLIGDVLVEGLTPMEVSEKLTKEFSKYVKNPAVSVIVTGFNSKKIYVIGEVFRQGAYPYTGDTTVFEAVEDAGSFTRRASLGRVILVRGDLTNPLVIDVNMKDVVRRGLKSKDLYVKPGDIVYVPPNGFAKAGYAIEQVLFPFSPILGVGRDIGYLRELQGVAD